MWSRSGARSRSRRLVPRLAEPGLDETRGLQSRKGRPRRGRLQGLCTRLAEPGPTRRPARKYGQAGLDEAGYTGACPARRAGSRRPPGSWKGRPRRGRLQALPGSPSRAPTNAPPGISERPASARPATGGPVPRLAEPGLDETPPGISERPASARPATGLCTRLAEPGLDETPGPASRKGRPRRGRLRDSVPGSPSRAPTRRPARHL